MAQRVLLLRERPEFLVVVDWRNLAAVSRDRESGNSVAAVRNSKHSLSWVVVVAVERTAIVVAVVAAAVEVVGCWVSRRFG